MEKAKTFVSDLEIVLRSEFPQFSYSKQEFFYDDRDEAVGLSLRIKNTFFNYRVADMEIAYSEKDQDKNSISLLSKEYPESKRLVEEAKEYFDKRKIPYNTN